MAKETKGPNSVEAGSSPKRSGVPRWNPDLAWPVGITLALTVVVLVNLVFIVYAVNTSDPVDPVYLQGNR